MIHVLSAAILAQVNFDASFFSVYSKLFGNFKIKVVQNEDGQKMKKKACVPNLVPVGSPVLHHFWIHVNLQNGLGTKWHQKASRSDEVPFIGQHTYRLHFLCSF